MIYMRTAESFFILAYLLENIKVAIHLINVLHRRIQIIPIIFKINGLMLDIPIMLLLF